MYADKHECVLDALAKAELVEWLNKPRNLRLGVECKRFPLPRQRVRDV